jgi:hypothetical protein
MEYAISLLVSLWLVFVFLKVKKLKSYPKEEKLFKKEIKNTIDIEKTSRRKLEKQIAKALQCKGYETQIWPWFNDWWIDVRARKEGEIFVIQCKHWRGDFRVKVKDIREFYWAITLYNRKFNYEGKGIFITTGKSSQHAKEEAKQLWIELRDEDNYITKLINL